MNPTHRERTEYFLACQSGCLEDVKELVLNKGVDPASEVRDDFWVTGLHMAAQTGHTDLARFLLDHGADVDVALLNDLTALHLAACHGHEDMALLLLQRGADPRRKDHCGNTPRDLVPMNEYPGLWNLLAWYEDLRNTPGGNKPHSPLDDFRSELSLKIMSSMDLNLLLSMHNLDCDLSNSRQTLLHRATFLRRAYWVGKLGAPSSTPLSGVDDKKKSLCKICMEVPINSMFLECGHMTTCYTCGLDMMSREGEGCCPTCKQRVSKVVKIFKA